MVKTGCDVRTGHLHALIHTHTHTHTHQHALPTRSPRPAIPSASAVPGTQDPEPNAAPALPANIRLLRDLQLAPRVFLAHIQQPRLRSAARFAGRTQTLRQVPLRATARLVTLGELMHARRARLGASRRSRVMRSAVCVRPASIPMSQPR
jgi:hypothetical protein